MLRRAKKKVADAEEEISRIEGEIADIEADITAGNITSDIYDRHAAKTKQLENAMSLWELASMEYEELSAK